MLDDDKTETTTANQDIGAAIDTEIETKTDQIVAKSEETTKEEETVSTVADSSFASGILHVIHVLFL